MRSLRSHSLTGAFLPLLAIMVLVASVLSPASGGSAAAASSAAAEPSAASNGPVAGAPSGTAPRADLAAGSASPAASGSASSAAAVASIQSSAEEDGKRSIELADILAWKRIGGARLSRDGAWFGYRLSPTEGDSEVVLRSTADGTEHRFDVGEVSGGSAVAFSADSRWAAYTVYPDRAAAKRLREQRRPLRNNVAVVDLTSGESRQFDGVRSFAFAGDAGGWIALHRYPPEGRGGRGGAGGGPGRGGAPGGGEERREEPVRGADLLLVELEGGAELNVGNVAEFAFDESGRWLAWVVDTEGKAGNGVQLRDMRSGVVRPLESDRARYRSLTWSEEDDDGDDAYDEDDADDEEYDELALAILKGVDDEAWEEPLYQVIGFRGFDDDGPERLAYDPADDPDFPAGMTISPNRSPQWTDDRQAILFGIHEVERKEGADRGEETEEGEEGDPEEPGEPEAEAPRRQAANGDAPDDEEVPDLVIWHWKDERLQSMQQVQERRDQSFSYLALWRVEEDRFVRLADDAVETVSPAPGHRWAIGTDDSAYELTGNLDGRRYRDVYAIDMHTGERRHVLERARWAHSASPDGERYLFYEDGDYWTLELASGQRVNITASVPTSFADSEDDHNVQDPPIFPIGWSSDGEHVLLYDNWDIWKVAADGADRGVNLTVSGRDEGVRYRRRFVLDRDQEGIDLSKPLWLAPYHEWTKKAGIGRIEPGTTGVRMLLWDDASFSGLMKAEDADVYLYTRATNQEYPDWYVTRADSLDGAERITDGFPEQERYRWSSGARLLDYESEQGDRLQAALFLPADYEPGERYPTIVYIYERLSQGLNSYSFPSANGFNPSVYNSHGYAVLMPDITYKVNDPGMSAVWCVLPALEAAVATGVVDPERVGLHGHSWGGYQTSFLVTQTQTFKAAIAGAPLTNLISMYSSIYWNSGSANQPIFESSQGRFTGDYIEARDAYIRNSPVFFADRVTTPLIILHNDRDGAVDWNQGIEYYNTLRRLGKEVVMLQYVGENHGLREPANRKDYTIRMKEFFDHHLKGAPAPDWLRNGVPHLQLEEHLEERARMLRGSAKDSGGRGSRGGGGSE